LQILGANKMAIVLKPVHISGMDRLHENGVKKIRYNADKNTPLPEQAGALEVWWILGIGTDF